MGNITKAPRPAQPAGGPSGVSKLVLGRRPAIADNTVDAVAQLAGADNVRLLGDPRAPLRLAVLGNSITWHAPKPDIGWEGDYGMAASCAQADYINILYENLSQRYGSVCIGVFQAAQWESSLTGGPADERPFSTLLAFRPAAALWRLAENVPLTVERTYFGACARAVLDRCLGGVPLVVTTSFWPHAAVDPVLRELAAERGASLVELGDLGDNPAMKALGRFAHAGVAAHPGDAGMRAIAERVLAALTPILEKNDEGSDL